MDQLTKKMFAATLGAIVMVLLLAIPSVALSAPILIPVQAVGDFFSSIGNFTFGGSEEEELITMIRFSLDQDDVKAAINKTYSPVLEKYQNEKYPVHYYVVVQYLAGIDFEDMDEEKVRELIDASVGYKDVLDENGNVIQKTQIIVNLPTYTENIKKIKPYNLLLSNITSQGLSQIIDAIGSIESYDRLDQEILDKYIDKMVYPFSKHYRISTRYGEWYDPEKDGTFKEHNAIDIVAPCGTPIYASSDGKVSFTNVNAPLPSRGNYVTIETREDDLEILLYHLQATPAVKSGQIVSKGDFVGLVGNTGYSFGCHLHFEMRHNGKKINPGQFIDFSKPN